MLLKRHYQRNYFWLDDSTHFTFKTRNQKVKTAEKFAFYIRKKYNFTNKVCIFYVIMTS